MTALSSLQDSIQLPLFKNTKELFCILNILTYMYLSSHFEVLYNATTLDMFTVDHTDNVLILYKEITGLNVEKKFLLLPPPPQTMQIFDSLEMESEKLDFVGAI